MKKLLLILMMFMMATLSFSATKKTNTNKIKEKIYEGEYVKSTNTFTYKKNNLVLPDKLTTYQIIDNSNLLDGIYSFISQNYGVTDNDVINLRLIGRVAANDKKSLIVSRITNYRIPQDKVNGAVEISNIESNLRNEIESSQDAVNTRVQPTRQSGYSNTEIEEIVIPELIK